MALKALGYGYKDDQEGFLKWEKQSIKCCSDSVIVFFFFNLDIEKVWNNIHKNIENCCLTTGIVDVFIFCLLHI